MTKTLDEMIREIIYKYIQSRICYDKNSSKSPASREDVDGALAVYIAQQTGNDTLLLFEFSGVVSYGWAESWCYKYLQDKGIEESKFKEIILNEGYTYDIELGRSNFAVLITVSNSYLSRWMYQTETEIRKGYPDQIEGFLLDDFEQNLKDWAVSK